MGITDNFKVLSDPIRRRILILLKTGRMTAGELAEALEMTPAALSYHLKLLKKTDLVMEYKFKNYIYYELNTTIFSELILWMKQFSDNKEMEGNDKDEKKSK